MGASHSSTTTTNESDVTYINENTYNLLNKNITNAVANAIIKNDTTCQALTSIDQIVDFSKCKVAGDLNISGVTQNSTASVDFSCLNVAKAEQAMAQTILSEMVADLQTEFDNQAINNMKTAASTSSSSSGLFTTGSNSSTTTNNKYNLVSDNKVNTEIQNVIINNINTNFETENIQKCIGDLEVKQKQDYSSCEVGGSLNVSDLEQTSSVSTVVDCVNKSGTTQNIINNIGSDLNIAVKSTTTNSSTSEITTETETKSTADGSILSGCSGCTSLCGCDSSYGCCIWLIVIIVILIVGYYALTYFLNESLGGGDSSSDYSDF